MAPFCSCPVSLVSRNFFAVVPGCAKFFFFVAPCWAPRPFGGPGQKKHHPGCVFFCSGPGERQGKEKPRWVPARGQSKKKHPGWLFFLLWPRRKVAAPNGAQHCTPGNDSKNCCRKQRHGARAKRGHNKKKNDSLTAALDRDAHSLLFRGDFSGWCFFFLLRPRADAHSPTAVLGGDASRRGGVFFFCCGPARTGVVFFLLWPRPDAHSLTVRWGDFGKALVIFFCCGPAEPGEPITKNVW